MTQKIDSTVFAIASRKHRPPSSLCYKKMMAKENIDLVRKLAELDAEDTNYNESAPPSPTACWQQQWKEAEGGVIETLNDQYFKSHNSLV